MTSLSKKPVTKKRGRPVGSKNKTKPAAKVKTFKQSDADMQRLKMVGEIVQKNLELIKDNTELVNHINKLEHQIIGFRAVISYLENQAGLRNTQ
jgi:hypothetical protein